MLSDGEAHAFELTARKPVPNIARYKTAEATLAKLAVIGGGPAYSKWGGRVLYEEADLLSWAEGRLTPKVLNTARPLSDGREGMYNRVIRGRADGR